MLTRSLFFTALLIVLALAVPASGDIGQAEEPAYSLKPAGEDRWVIQWDGDIDAMRENMGSATDVDRDRALLKRQIEIITKINGQGEDALPIVTPEFFLNDTFTMEFMLGFLSGGLLQCIREHMSDMGDNEVLFDGLSELLDPYLNGTQPLVFEFESTSMENPDNNTASIFGLGDEQDLFPEGFTDPETGDPLDFACVELGINDTLDSSEPLNVTNAELEFYRTGTGSLFGPFDITSSFSNPFSGRLSIGLSNLPGLDIDEVQLRMEFQPTDIFADGFESGDATSWTDSVP